MEPTAEPNTAHITHRDISSWIMVKGFDMAARAGNPLNFCSNV